MGETKVARAKSKLKQTFREHFNVLILIFVCVYLLFGLFAFLYLQGDMNDWYAFMRNDASVTLFTTYCVTGIIGLASIMLLKRDPNLLKAPHKILTASFLVIIIAGVGAFTYLNFRVTQDNYLWMNDGLVYQRMAQSFLSNHEFVLDGNFTHHFGPIYPLYLSIFYSFLSVDVGTQIAVEIGFVMSIVVVFLVTNRMYGDIPALITTGLVATVPTYVFAASRNYSEPFVLALFTLTLYFILESLKPKKENRIILAGFTAALGFLTKSGTGYFFIIAGVSGFLWRFHYLRWDVFKNKNYIIAILVFFSLLGTWTVRNVYHFWDGTLQGLVFAVQPSNYMNEATSYTFSLNFGGFFLEILFFAVFLGFFLLAYSWFFVDYLKASMKRIRDERVSCLLLSILLTIVIGLIITVAYFIYETSWMPTFFVSYFPQQQVRYFLLHMVRYCFIVIIPLTWFAYEAGKKNSFEKHVV
ncbi:ArnT family glycosyltransferase [Thermoproteota archaeon]